MGKNKIDSAGYCRAYLPSSFIFFSTIGIIKKNKKCAESKF